MKFPKALSVHDSTLEAKAEEESSVSQKVPCDAPSLAGASEGGMDSSDVRVDSEHSCWGCKSITLPQWGS